MPKNRQAYNYKQLMDAFGPPIAAKFREEYGKGDKLRVWITTRQKTALLHPKATDSATRSLITQIVSYSINRR